MVYIIVELLTVVMSIIYIAKKKIRYPILFAILSAGGNLILADHANLEMREIGLYLSSASVVFYVVAAFLEFKMSLKKAKVATIEILTDTEMPSDQEMPSD